MKSGYSYLPALATLLSLSLPQLLRADTVILTPTADTTISGTVNQFFPFGRGTTPTTFQFDVAASQLETVVGDTIDKIGFRLPAGNTDIPGPTVIGTFNLQLSSSLNPIGGLSSTFANNIANNVQTVYSGNLTLGPLTGGPGPNPFFFIPFSTPYLYTGGDLLSTIFVDDSTNLVISVDANLISTVQGIGDTVGGTGGVPVVAEYYNDPVAAFSASTSSTVTVTPEPSSIALLLTGVAAVGITLYRRLYHSV